jgi:hypothetical protein
MLVKHLRKPGHLGRVLIVLAVAGAGFGIATAVQADIPDSGVINSCYGKLNGHFLRVIDTSRGEKCAFNQNPLSWNATGVSGATGAIGPTGPTGPSGSWYAQGDVPSNTTTATLASLTLPPGNYTLSAAGGSSATVSGNTNVRCSLRGFVSADEDAFYSVNSSSYVNAEFAIDINIALPSGGTVNLQCLASGAGPVFTAGQIQATEVQTLNSTTPLQPHGAQVKPSVTRTP